MFAHHVFVADGGKVSLSRAQRRTAGQLALRSRIGGPDHYGGLVTPVCSGVASFDRRSI
jgi:hypothetical protein